MDYEEKYDVGSASLDPMSSGLLVNVIRTLTSSVSDDQRELERLRLEKGHAHSGLVIDELLKEHETDVEQCLISFRQVFNGITSCREHIHNVKNALLTCKSLLQCRRDDLKKLWMESAEQNYVSKIIQEIYEIKHIDQLIETHIEEGHYRNAADTLKKADILLSGPLSQIAGLQELRTNVSVNNENLFEKIVLDLLHWIVVVPLDCQILELMKSLTENQINESCVCMAIITKYSTVLKSSLSPIYISMIAHWSPLQAEGISSHNVGSALETSYSTPELVRRKVIECLSALRVFDQLDSAIENIFSRTSSQCLRAISDSVAVLRLLVKDGMGDATHFYQLCQLIIHQFTDCAFRFGILLDELQNIHNVPVQSLTQRLWDILQDVLESVASEHLEIWRTTDGEKGGEDRKRKTKTLFSFDNTSFVVAANSTFHKKQSNLICPASPYNISAVFHIFNRFAKQVEKIFEDKICKFDTFLHTFVMEEFIERLRADLEAKTDVVLSGTEVWSSVSHVPSYNTKILTSGIRIFELCEMINEFILKMGSYTQRFASLWLLIIAAYTKSATDMYSQIIRTRSHQGESLIDYPKISAAWAVDEDISRLLKSLPSWTNISNLSSPSINGESAALLADVGVDGGKISHGESEQDIRLRTQRESEILIGNLGTQKQIQRAELITDMEHVKSLVCMHESLHWFVCNMRKIIENMPEANHEIIKCRVQFTTNDNDTMVEQLLSEALEERLNKLENMAETCLLMLYLEIRVHCFYHLLPLTRSRNSTVPQEEQDRELTEFGRDLIHYNQTLSVYVGPWKLKYLFAGLGHLCASIFIHSSQYLSKLSESDQKRICRNIFTVQKSLSQLSGRPEAEMNRAQTFFKLVNMEIDQIFALVKESGESYSYLELTYLLSLAVRSNAVLSSQPGALEAILNQLRENLSK